MSFYNMSFSIKCLQSLSVFANLQQVNKIENPWALYICESQWFSSVRSPPIGGWLVQSRY